MNKVKIKSKNLNVHYGQKQALFDVNLDLNEKEVTALIGPSGCGKSTFIRCINRMNDVIDICKVTGNIEIDGEKSFNFFNNYYSDSEKKYFNELANSLKYFFSLSL